MKSFIFRLTLVLAFVFGGLILTEAQSGRRSMGTPTPYPTPEATPTPKPKSTPKPAPKPEFKIRIISNISRMSSQVFSRPDDAAGWVAARLGDSPLLDVGGVTEGSGKDAKRMATESEGEYVLLLQLNDSSFSASSASANDISLSFTLYIPKTAKTKVGGSTYLRPELLRSNAAYNRRRVCYPSLRDAEYLLLEAANETAERVMSSLNLSIPQDRCSKTPGFFTQEFISRDFLLFQD